MNRKRSFSIFYHHSKHGTDPHPKNRTGTADGDGTGGQHHEAGGAGERGNQNEQSAHDDQSGQRDLWREILSAEQCLKK